MTAYEKLYSLAADYLTIRANYESILYELENATDNVIKFVHKNETIYINKADYDLKELSWFIAELANDDDDKLFIDGCDVWDWW